MKTKIIFISLILAFTFGTSVLNAQQTPKKGSTTKKTTKPAVKKKAGAKNSGSVYIWDGSYFYHKTANCPDLKKSNKSNRKVLTLPLQQAKGQFSAKPCKKCY
jgi:hypothetical protein